jgi:phospholipid transport system transporter-binding protein
MTQQLSWSREGETLALQGELDQDLLNPCGMRHEAMKGVLHRSERTYPGGYGGLALLLHLIAGQKQGKAVAHWRER